MSRSIAANDAMKYSFSQQHRFFLITFAVALMIYLASIAFFILNPAFISLPISVIAFLPMIMLMLWCIVRERARDLGRAKWSKFNLLPIGTLLATICYSVADHSNIASNRYFYAILASIASLALSDVLDALSILKGKQSEQ